MKKLIAIAFIALLSTSVYSATKCVPDGRGGMCCWDTDKDGPWKPIGC
jgi:hypothetical protein